jgi:protein TonB
MNALRAAVRAELVGTQRIVERARARAGDAAGELRIEVTISRDGRLEDARIVRSSGAALVDAAALRAARAVRRYPAAPDALPGARFVFQTWLRFDGG